MIFDDVLNEIIVLFSIVLVVDMKIFYYMNKN